MKFIETILAHANDTDMMLEGVHQALARVDGRYYEEERETYENGVRALLQVMPEAEVYLQARRQEFASDIRFAMWQGFKWKLDCFRDPVYKLMGQLDFEERCKESQMHSLPAVRQAQATARAFIQTLSEDKRFMLDFVIDYYAYLETWGYKLAFNTGAELATVIVPAETGI